MSYWDSYYRRGCVPWDPGPYDGHLPGLLKEFSIPPCRVVDIGCGTGKSLIWLAEKGFVGTGIDVSGAAIRAARELARRKSASCTWMCGSFPEDFPEEVLPSGSFDFAVERGCLQHLHPSRAAAAARGVSRILRKGGLWYSLTAARTERPHFDGVPRWSSEELIDIYTPCFEILRMEEAVFTYGERGSIPAWLCVCRNRSHS